MTENNENNASKNDEPIYEGGNSLSDNSDVQLMGHIMQQTSAIDIMPTVRVVDELNSIGTSFASINNTVETSSTEIAALHSQLESIIEQQSVMAARLEVAEARANAPIKTMCENLLAGCLKVCSAIKNAAAKAMEVIGRECTAMKSDIASSCKSFIDTAQKICGETVGDIRAAFKETGELSKDVMGFIGNQIKANDELNAAQIKALQAFAIEKPCTKIKEACQALSNTCDKATNAIENASKALSNAIQPIKAGFRKIANGFSTMIGKPDLPDIPIEKAKEAGTLAKGLCAIINKVKNLCQHGIAQADKGIEASKDLQAQSKILQISAAIRGQVGLKAVRVERNAKSQNLDGLMAQCQTTVAAQGKNANKPTKTQNQAM